MQTFVPETSFANSVRVLDRQRLGKQRVETLQIMNALVGESKGWTNHPATRMWRGYEDALLTYQMYTVREWKSRGYKDTCWEKTCDVYAKHFGAHDPFDVSIPHWWGDDRVHDSHKSALVFKDPVWYNQVYPDVVGEYNYYWPVGKE
jgi:Pyrimidine dimer DNA glycosylase